jgi:2,4-dienoyl-CoA reductase-like NADH-dependent reductase (Old Yellow Enzyme family)/thioredoxin reductase
MAGLFDPVMVGKMEVKNRIWSGPLVSNWATEDGNVTPQMVKAYYERAAGGWGLIQVEATYVVPEGNMFARMSGFYRPHQITGWSEVAGAIKDAGARSSIQLVHGGRQANAMFTGGVKVSASDVGWAGMPSRPLTTEECDELVEHYGNVCSWSKMAGFDTVLLHGAHGFLIGQFSSPYTNKRTDKYGDRYRFVTDIIRAVKSACGEDFPVCIRISADEFLGDKGLTLEEVTKNYVPALEEAGIDHLDISCGVFETGEMIIQPLYSPRGVIMHLAEGVKKAAKRSTVSGVGRVNDPALAKSIVEDGRADVVILARQALADPDFPRKLQEGRSDDIRKCIVCDLGCTWAHVSQLTIDCSINPRVGHELEYLYEEPEDRMRPAAVRKKVWVIGGGVAGMEAARVAKLRQHDVVIFEKDKNLGGTVRLAAGMPQIYTRELGNIVTWELMQLEKLGVAVRSGKEVNAEMIEKGKPDAVIVATGSREIVPHVPGADGPNVATLLTCLKGEAEVGDKVVILGGQEGAELSVSLAKQGKNVTLLESTDGIADLPYFRWGGRRSQLHAFLVEQVEGGKLTVYTGAELKEIRPKEVVFLGREPSMTWVQTGSYAAGGAEEEGEAAEAAERTVAADTVIVALGREPNRELSEALKGKVPEVYEVGDAVRVYDIRHSIHSGARIGRLI